MPMIDDENDLPPSYAERDFRHKAGMEQTGLGGMMFYVVLGICVVVSLYLRVVGL